MKDVKRQSHYTGRSIQPLAYFVANKSYEKVVGAMELNIEKYMARWEDKNGVEDLKKARAYLDFLIEYVETGTIDVPV